MANGQMCEGSAPRVATRQTVLIIWCVLFAGALGFTIVAAIIGPGVWPRISDAGGIVAWVVFGMAVTCFVASRVLPNRIKPTPGATAETLAIGRTLVAIGLNGSVAVQAPLAWMVSGNAVALAALAISLVGLLLVAPSRRRWDTLCRAIATTFAKELAAADDATPPTAPPGRVLALFVGLAALGAVALILAGNEFWTTEVLRRPGSPVARFLMLSGFAAMMAALAAMRFIGAASNRRPRWQRAYGVLLLVWAGCLLVLALRMV
jgi:hypothetical protein